MHRKIGFLVLLIFALMFFLTVNDVSAANTTENTTFTVDQVTNASTTVQSYVETNHQLPNNVTVSETTVSMPQMLEMETTAVLNINSNTTTSNALGNYGSAPNPREDIKSGTMSKAEYLKIAKDVKSFMDTKGVTPEYVYNTSLGYFMRYESLVYIYSQILNSYRKTNALPSFITVTPWEVVSNPKTVFLSMDQVNTAAGTVQSYVETNHQLPNTVTISETTVNMPQFLELETTSLLNIYGGLYASIVLGSFGPAPNPKEDIKSGNIGSIEYLKIAVDVKSFMDTKGVAPEYAYNTTLGYYLGYQNLVYIYSQILNSGGINQFLPNFITANPWKVVSNPNTVFLSMDQINTAMWTVKSYVETSHQLPDTVTISGRQITMSQFLEIETTALLNMNGSLYVSIILGSFNAAPKPKEEIKSGNMPKTEYLKIAGDVKSFMDSKGVAPEYAYNTSLGYYLGYQNLVYIYTQILNSYNVNKVLPEFITLTPWSVISNPNTMFLSMDQICDAAGEMKTFIETNHKLPDIAIAIDRMQINKPQFLELLTTALLDFNGKLSTSIVMGIFGSAPNPRDEIRCGNMPKTEYLKTAGDVKAFMDSKGVAPEYVYNTSLGYYLGYDNLVYIYAQILSSYNLKNVLPDFITLTPWSVISNPNTVFLSVDQIDAAAGTVQSYVETNHQLPSNVTISGTTASMPQFLELLTTTILDINSNLNTSIVMGIFGSAPNPRDEIHSGNMPKTEYLKIAGDVKSFMDGKGTAPEYAYNTSLGYYLGYQNLIYIYTQILSSYKTKKVLPDFITLTPWSVISNPNTVFLSVDQVDTAAETVQSYVETNHQLPINVTISGATVNMPQFLELLTTTILDLNGNLNTSILLGTFGPAPNPQEDIKSGNIGSTEYLKIAEDVKSFMDGKGVAPEYAYNTSLGYYLGYHNLIHIYTQILSSYKTKKALPDFITVTPWTIVSNSNTVFLGMDQINTAAGTVKSYVESNHQLPSNVIISGTTVSMPQFLKLSVKSVLNVYGYLNTSIVLENVGSPTDPKETINSGIILNNEFVDMAKTIKTYMDSNGSAPSYASNTSLGDYMGFESLVYIYSQILNSYDTSKPLTDHIAVIPWIAVSNPNKTYNFRTQEIFTSIQVTIDNINTQNGDTIWLGNLTYSENVLINKKVILKPVTGVNVNVQALNPSLPVFTINTSGSGSTIKDLTINGSTSSAGIYINSSNENNVLGNTIKGNGNGLYLDKSTDNVISGNTISQNSANGVFINTGSDNTVSGNTVTYNGADGVNINNSNDNIISSNTVSNNTRDGIHLYNSSAEINFNRIVSNNRYGLYKESNGIVDATNNWWGSNNPTVSSNSPSDVYIVEGTVNYNPYLVLNINSSCDRSDRTGTYYNYLITADLTHNNQGNDTSSDGNIPDGVPINFSTTIGTISTSESTKKGKSTLKLTSTTADTANISTALDNQTVSKTVNVTRVDVLGVYNNRTQKGFATIQAAINDSNTLNGDIITLADGTYTENVAVNKKITLKPITGDNVTIKTADADKSVLVINNGGSGSVIQGLNIAGAGDSYGVALSHAFNCNINNNTISNSSNGIYLYLSGNNTITGNTIENNYYGICLYKSTSNNLSGNTVKYNENGIYLYNSNHNLITGSTVTDNWYGIYLYYSNSISVSGNTFKGNWVGVYLYNTNNNSITNNNCTDNGVGITYYNSIGTAISGNSFNNNWIADSSVINSDKIVMATTIYSCGPAALATVLKTMGIYATEAELAKLAGTNETGTSLYGLKTAAQAKGVTATAVRLTTDQLKTNYIVVLSINGYNHFEVIKSITTTTVTLIDPNLGTVEMTLTKFNELYTGVALIINGTVPANAVRLTDGEMRNIKAMSHLLKVQTGSYWVPGYVYWTYKWIDTSFYVPYIYWKWVPGYYLWGWIYIPGHYEPRIGWRYVRCGFCLPIPHYVKGYWRPIYTYILVPDVEIHVNWDRARNNFETELSIAGLVVGSYFGVTEGISAGAALGLGLGGGGTLMSVVNGRLDHMFDDPSLEVKIDGKTVFRSY
jgi:trimeric autotransporter adhesin